MKFFFFLSSFLFFIACSEEPSFNTCDSSSVADLAKLSANLQTTSFCRTLEGEVVFEYKGLCSRGGCFFIYDLDEENTRGESIYLSDVTCFPSSWRDSSKTHRTRVTGEYFPARVPCEELNNQDCQRAFFVTDVDD